jgi:hypothetical protein
LAIAGKHTADLSPQPTRQTKMPASINVNDIIDEMEIQSEKITPFPAGHKSFVRIVTSAGALSAGVPDSYQKTLRALRLPGRSFSEAWRLRGSVFFMFY